MIPFDEYIDPGKYRQRKWRHANIRDLVARHGYVRPERMLTMLAARGIRVTVERLRGDYGALRLRP